MKPTTSLLPGASPLARALLLTLALAGTPARAADAPSIPAGVLNLTGSLEAREDVHLQAQVAGRLVEVAFKEGDSFKKGDVLARVDPADYEISVREAQAAVESAESRLAAMEAGGRALERERAAAELASAQAVHRNALQNLQIARGLHESGGTSRQSLDAARRELDVAASRVVVAERSLSLVRQGPRSEERRGARAEVDRARALLARAELRLSDASVRAPFDGTVLQKYVSPGTNVVAPAQNAQGLCLFADISRLKALVDVPEAWLTAVSVGREVKLSVRAHPDRTFAGRVTALFPYVDSKSRNGRFEVEVDNPARELLPGMFVKVTLDPRPANRKDSRS